MTNKIYRCGACKRSCFLISDYSSSDGTACIYYTNDTRWRHVPKIQLIKNRYNRERKYTCDACGYECVAIPSLDRIKSPTYCWQYGACATNWRCVGFVGDNL